VDQGETAKDVLQVALRDYVRSKEMDEVIEEILDADNATDRWDIVAQLFYDRYEDNGDRNWLWEKDGYELSNCLVSDVFVSKSPYFTYAQHCSPCCPGALNLDNPFEGLAVPQGNHASFAEDFKWNAEAAGFPACYCLGHDFFDGEKAPYEVFCVATGKRVVMVEKKEECPNCKGTGSDTSERVEAIRRAAGWKEEDLIVRNANGVAVNGSFKCWNCGGLGYEVKKMEVEQ